MNSLLEAFSVDWRRQSVLTVSDRGDAVARRLRGELGAEAVDTLDGFGELPDGYDDRTYDVALIEDVLYTLSPTGVHDALGWVRDRLTPGARCLLETRTYLGSDGGGLGDHLHTPYVHLAFAREVIDAYHSERGWSPPRYANAMCRATYLILLRRLGFVIEEVQVEEEVPQLFGEKLQWYEPGELRASLLRIRARLPTERERERELATLRAALKAR